ncbi:hypothetical protein D5I93_11690 [Escherichia coli]|nr:hypothetical protein BFL18_24765 [Escherichia coli]EAC0749003.1 hypothetical protein [Escherichia coli]EEW3594715.1 hypothetical protein [Escherichia coli]EEW4729240.1 hypothetical protein [Escherichia coli]EEW8322124.1 hypothetical protein [Escherichia coli]
MSIDHSLRFVQILLFIYTESFYNITVRNVLCGGRIVTRRTKSWLKRVVPSAP